MNNDPEPPEGSRPEINSRYFTLRPAPSPPIPRSKIPPLPPSLNKNYRTNIPNHTLRTRNKSPPPPPPRLRTPRLRVAKPEFFTNAKSTWMLEYGYERAIPKMGDIGLLVINDGPEMNIKIERALHITKPSGKLGFTVSLSDNPKEPVFDILFNEMDKEWIFYIKTNKVPFIPRTPFPRGGSKKIRNKRATGKKTRGKLRRKA